MSTEICPVCKKIVTKGLSITHKQCGHRTHGHCMDQANPNFLLCSKCVGDDLETSIEHPTTFNGRDYIESPIVPSLFASLSSVMRKKESILTKQLPLDHLIAQHGYTLQRLLSEGVSFDDFINNGYSYKDLELYPSIHDRKLKTLVALKCTADHFKKGQIPLENISARNIVEYFGLYFPEKCGALTSPSNEYWSAADLVGLGFTAEDLFGAGLEYLEQYEDLEPSPEDERALGMTKQDIDELFVYNQPIEEHEQVVYVEQRREPEQVVYVEHRREPEYRRPKSIPRIKRHHGFKKK